MTRQRRCRICHERPPWHGKNCPPGICKPCYHREIWVDRPAARRERHEAERAAAADPLADFAGPLVYDGYLGSHRPADLFSGDPLDLEAIAVWEEENGVPWDPDAEDHDKEPLTAAPAPRTPRSPSTEHPRGRLCRKVHHHYAESADGLFRVCLACAAGLPLAQLTGADAAAELIAQRRPVHRRDFVQRLRARFPELPWDTGIVREGRQRRHVPHTAADTIAGTVVNTPNQT
jgi:hypothetical protein